VSASGVSAYALKGNAQAIPGAISTDPQRRCEGVKYLGFRPVLCSHHEATHFRQLIVVPAS
jgi:hypothetical protein